MGEARLLQISYCRSVTWMTLPRPRGNHPPPRVPRPIVLWSGSLDFVAARLLRQWLSWATPIVTALPLRLNRKGKDCVLGVRLVSPVEDPHIPNVFFLSTLHPRLCIFSRNPHNTYWVCRRVDEFLFSIPISAPPIPSRLICWTAFITLSVHMHVSLYA